MVAELRRNFPFYSPRYIAHMLSDTSLPSILGYFAGLLYNPNNVTTEAAPVTVNMEIEACNSLLKMLGFNPPPHVPESFDEESLKAYKKKLEKEFGWAHLTLGGTTANLEALWVARQVKYMPLAIWDVAKEENLEIEVKLPNGDSRDIREVNRRQLLFIKSNESIYLLARYVQAYRKKHGVDIQEASSQAYDLLEQSEYSVKRGFGRLLLEFPPVIFVSGTAHYSIQKAADILGLGKGSVNFIRMSPNFRIDVSELKRNIEQALSENRIPLAVVSIVGTTEEGAVDPVHEIVILREEFEEQHNVSFWLHVDAAWGGYMRSLFNFTPRDTTCALIKKISRQLDLPLSYDFVEWTQLFFDYVESNIEGYALSKASQTEDDSEAQAISEEIRRKITSERHRFDNHIARDDMQAYQRALRDFISDFRELGLESVDVALHLIDRIDFVNDYVSDEVKLEHEKYSREIQVKWGSKEVCSALFAISFAESVTMDPHKMGYVNYPCGLVAFRNDRVRHFIRQEAPYITSVRQDVLIHMPPKHPGEKEDESFRIDAFAPFIVEGSRPGAAATALWLTTRSIPPTLREAGSVVKASLLAARELHEWFVHWDVILKHNQHDVDYQFLQLTHEPPDTNLVIFTVRKRTSNSLLLMNELTTQVYQSFTIQAELGEMQYSYSQPYFLSKTEFKPELYPFESLKPFFERNFSRRHLSKIRSQYQESKMVVLRATVMNPYISLVRQITGQSILKSFMLELAKAAEEAVKYL